MSTVCLTLWVPLEVSSVLYAFSSSLWWHSFSTMGTTCSCSRTCSIHSQKTSWTWANWRENRPWDSSRSAIPSNGTASLYFYRIASHTALAAVGWTSESAFFSKVTGTFRKKFMSHRSSSNCACSKFLQSRVYRRIISSKLSLGMALSRKLRLTKPMSYNRREQMSQYKSKI